MTKVQLQQGRLARLWGRDGHAAPESGLSRLPGRSPQRVREAVANLLAHEHRRIAADVHDLVMQDLALALGSARVLADHPAHAHEANVVVEACERALTAARTMIDDLLACNPAPVLEAVGAGASEAAGLVPINFYSTDVPTGDEPDAATLDVILHVTREAVRNAVKHASPSSIEVVLEHQGSWRLLISDDGGGFDPRQPSGGFGLGSMRTQAGALGGTFSLRSRVGTGTTVEAVLP